MTLNHKYTPPRMVEIIHATGRQLSIAELETNFRVNDRLESNLPTPISPQGSTNNTDNTNLAVNDRLESDFPTPISPNSSQDYPIATTLAGVPEGKRDTEIFKLAQSLNRASVPMEYALSLVKQAAANCNPPFPSPSPPVVEGARSYFVRYHLQRSYTPMRIRLKHE